MSHSYDHGGNIFTIARTLGVTPEQILDFSASINPLGMSPLVRETLINSLGSLVHYPDTSHQELKQALANYHTLSAENFSIANGSTELIYTLPAILPGKKALIISPSFSEYVHALNQHGWEIDHFVLSSKNNFIININELEHTLARGVDVLFVCNPGNPNGTLYPHQIIEEIYQACVSTGTFLVLDEAFMDFCEEFSDKHAVVHRDNVVILRSMTKFFGIPGLRLGYAISCRSLAGRLDSMGGPWSVNTLALKAGVAALHDSDHNGKSLEYISRERAILCKCMGRFPQLKLYPTSTNYLLVEIMNEQTSGEIKEQLLSSRIIIRDCSTFTGLTDKFFRIAVRRHEENVKLLECLG